MTTLHRNARQIAELAVDAWYSHASTPANGWISRSAR